MPFVVANGVRFHTFELGAGGSPVVMLHGLLVGNLASWYFTGARAVARKHRVLLYDLRGHGRSERVRDGYDVPTMTDDLEALVAGFSDEPITLVGHSYGGLIALEYARRHPDRIHRLVLVDAPLPPVDTAPMLSFLGKDRGEMVDALPPPLKAAVEAGGRRMSRLLSSLYFLAFETTLPQAVDARPDPTDAELAEVRCPTLCVYGTQSNCLPAGERLARVLPNVRYVLLEGGHYLPVECPTELAAELTGFLDGEPHG